MIPPEYLPDDRYKGPPPEPGDLICLNSIFLVSVVEVGPGWFTGTMIWEKYPDTRNLFGWWVQSRMTDKDWILAGDAKEW